MSTSAARMARLRERERANEMILQICVDRVAVVDLLVTAKTLDPALADNPFMVARAVERMLQIFSQEGPKQ